ncbi:hypothetical protein AM588_10010684 [Phytophthora nicotianae]|uniref:Uncharacterized protein n=1 Tax=Phytophthora nicotianae TaxID=4792 RepID=A0A0W8DGB1_PHYNI|nr:hypothetical protein AM588_10010684 [Phytophthora nicotianae]
MGNEQSTANGARGDGVPFVSWQRSPKSQPAGDIDAHLHSVSLTTSSYHFAEPSSYRYDRVPRVLTGNVVFTNPPKADGELRNKAELLGNIAIVERGGRVHFPDIVRRLLAVGVTGIVFIERTDNKHAIQSLFDGFHSSGRQRVSIPIVLLSKYHADRLLSDKPQRISIELLWREQACKHVVPDDVYFGVQTAARAGDVELLRHLLEIDTTGNVVDNIPKAVALCDAAENGHVDCIEILHSLGVSMDEQKVVSCVSPLMMACSVGNVEAARALLMFGASLDLEDSRGTTALHIAARAARAGNLGCVKVLVEAGASLIAKDRDGHTAEHLARIAGYTDIEDYLREQAESESVKNHRRKIEETVAKSNSTLRDLLKIAKSSQMSVDVLYREMIREHKSSIWLEQPRIIYEVFRLLTVPVTSPDSDPADDPNYGKYTVQHFCSEVALWYSPKIFQKGYKPGGAGWTLNTGDAYDVKISSGYLKVLFNFRTLGWGVGTSFQRDSIENICSLINYIIYPPSVYIMNNVATFVENTDHSLPLITDQHFPLHHNELFKSLLIFLLNTTDVSFGTLLDLGFAEVCRHCSQGSKSLVVREGGALSIVMMLMSTLGYHKKKRDVTSIDGLLKTVHVSVLTALIPRVEKFVKLCRAVVTSDVNALRAMSTSYNPGSIKAVNTKGSALLHIITFLKRMLHHELTDVIRFVLMDPDQKRLPSSPLLNSLFIEGANILDFVIRAYDEHVQYKGHMTTIANSIFTLTKSGSIAITCQDVVRQYTSQHEKWVKFEQVLAEQNRVEMLPLGQRNAPLCHGCLKLKQSAVEYVAATLTNAEVDEYTGYLETIFSGAASHYCKVTYTDEFITGFMYKKDKIHDHIPIPEPTRVSSFIQFPVPMPFHALTFTITFFGLCQVCDKLWYCDTLQSANWMNRMKWVIPTSVRKWYSFGVTEGPGSGAHGLQFSSKGYKNFIVLTDTWGRQEQWMHAIEDAIQSLATQMARGNTESAMAIEIDNEVDAEEFDVMRMREITAGSGGGGPVGVTSHVGSAPKSDSSTRSLRVSDEEESGRRRSNTMSSIESESAEFRDEDDQSSGTSSPSHELTMPSVRSRSSFELKCSENGSTSSSRKVKSSGDRRNLDLKRFQPDTQKFSEILGKLKIGSPPRVNKARAPAMSASGSFAPFAQRNTVSPHGAMSTRTATELVGMRHVVSTPDLTRLQG